MINHLPTGAGFLPQYGVAVRNSGEKPSALKHVRAKLVTLQSVMNAKKKREIAKPPV